MQAILKLPRVEKLVVARGIPDGRHLSDNQMLAARFRLAGTSGADTHKGNGHSARGRRKLTDLAPEALINYHASCHRINAFE